MVGFNKLKHMNITLKKSTLALFLAGLLALPLMALAAAPGNVKGVSATAESASSVKLNWNPVEGAEKYRVYYNSQADGGSVQNGETFAYVNQTDTSNSNTTFTLAGLQSDTMYYMAVTALTGEDESESYSLEVQAKTQGGASQQQTQNDQQQAATDTLAPMVLKVMAQDSTHVLVGFSEKVSIPTSNPQSAFTIKEQINANNTLQVKSAAIHAGDSTGKTVILETAPQSKNTNYVLTAGIQVKDEAGNAINSGSSDSAIFIGTDVATAANDTQNNNQTSVVDCGTHYANDPTKNTSGAKECFDVSFQTCTPATYTKVSVVDGKESEYEYEVVEKGSGVCKIETTYTKNEANPTWVNKSMTCEYNTSKDFTTAESELLNSLTTSAKLGNCTGELYTLMSSASSTSTQTSTDTTQTSADTTAPEDVTNLRLSFQQMANSALYMVGMNWTASVNSAGDLFDQIVYQSTDLGKTYDAGKSLGKDLTAYNAENLEGGKEYTFKLTTKDSAGNESTGAVKSIRLPESGAGAGLLLLGSGFAAHRMLRRKKRQ